MPASRAALIDIEEFGLSHDKEHRLSGTRLSSNLMNQQTPLFKEEKIVESVKQENIFLSSDEEVVSDVVETETTLDSIESSIETSDKTTLDKSKKKQLKKKKS